MFHFTYVLQFNNTKELYKGYTKNLKLRLELHKQGRVDSTRNKGPFKLIYFEGCLNQQDATHREKYLKKYLGRLFIKNRLKSYLIG
jgi:putative endonuclease